MVNNARKNIFLGIFLSGVLLSSLAPLPALAPWLILSLGAMIGIFTTSFMESREERKFLLKLFIISLFARAFLSLILYIASLDMEYHPGFFIDDGWGYSINGWTIAGRLSKGLSIAFNVIKSESISGTVSNYDYINGVIYFFTGYSPLSMLFFNCAIGAMTVILIYFISSRLFGKDVARLCSLLCAFWPSLFLWSTQNLKEPLTIFFVALCFWAFVRPHFLSLPIIVISIFCLAKIREQITLMVMISLLLYLVYSLYRLIRRDRAIFIVTLLIVIPALTFIIVNYGKDIIGLFNPFKAGQFALTDILAEVDYHRSVRAFANLAVLSDYKIESLGSLLKYIPLGLFFLLFAPFPWQIFSSSQMLAVPETIVWYFMVPYFIKGIYLTFKNKVARVFPILVYMVISLLALAVLEGNVGTMFRHKAVALNFILLFVAVGLTGFKNKPVTPAGA